MWRWTNGIDMKGLGKGWFWGVGKKYSDIMCRKLEVELD